MPTRLPPGHPGDAIWRLSLTRTLASLRAVTPEQVGAATLAAAKGGLFATHLVEAGVGPDQVLKALAVATGLHGAPRYETRNPPLELRASCDEVACRDLLAVPFGVDGDGLCIAFAVPLPPELTLALPQHKAFVGLEAEILQGLDLLFPPRRKRAEPVPFSAAVPPGGPVPQPGPAPAGAEGAAPWPPPPGVPAAVAIPPAPSAPPLEWNAPPGAPQPSAGVPAPAPPPLDFSGAPASSLEPSAAPPPLDFSAAPPPLDFSAAPPPSLDSSAAPPPSSELSPPAPAPPPPGSAGGGFDLSSLPPPASIALQGAGKPPGADGAVTSPAQAVPPPAAPLASTGGETFRPDPWAELKSLARQVRTPVLVIAALAALLKVGSCVIDRGRGEVEKRADELGAGIHAANQEAAKNLAAERRAAAGAPQGGRELPGSAGEPGSLAPGSAPGPLSGLPLPPVQPGPPEPETQAAGTFDSLTAALAQADVAAKAQSPEFSPACRALSAELQAYRVRTPLPARELAELTNLGTEVKVRCEQSGVPADFGALRDRLARVLKGEPQK